MCIVLCAIAAVLSFQFLFLWYIYYPFPRYLKLSGLGFPIIIFSVEVIVNNGV